MDNNGRVLLEKSGTEKRNIFQKRLREKTMGMTHCPASPEPGAAQLDLDIPERNFRVSMFPEYVAMQQRETLMRQLGIKNPYFKCNDGIVKSTTTIGGREYISYSSYNYLGFSGDERISAAARKAVDTYGTSVSASRLASGERPVHAELEKSLAEFIGVEDCLVLSAAMAPTSALSATSSGRKI